LKKGGFLTGRYYGIGGFFGYFCESVSLESAAWLGRNEEEAFGGFSFCCCFLEVVFPFMPKEQLGGHDTVAIPSLFGK
jgi:hypothetical protein